MTVEIKRGIPNRGGGGGGRLAFTTMSAAEVAQLKRVQVKCCERCSGQFTREVGSGLVVCGRCIAREQAVKLRERDMLERFRRL